MKGNARTLFERCCSFSKWLLSCVYKYILLMIWDVSLCIGVCTEMSFFLCISVIAEMTPTVLHARLGNTTELKCSIHYRGYAWSALNIVQQNTSGSVLLLNVSSNGNVEAKTARINGSVTKDDDYINVTVSFDMNPGTGVCELNQTYSCDIQLIDSSIGTIAANSTLTLESKYSLHRLDHQ